MLILALAAAALEPMVSVSIPFDLKGEASASADGLADIAASRRRVTLDDPVRMGVEVKF